MKHLLTTVGEIMKLPAAEMTTATWWSGVDGVFAGRADWTLNCVRWPWKSSAKSKLSTSWQPVTVRINGNPLANVCSIVRRAALPFACPRWMAFRRLASRNSATVSPLKEPTSWGCGFSVAALQCPLAGPALSLLASVSGGINGPDWRCGIN